MSMSKNNGVVVFGTSPRIFDRVAGAMYGFAIGDAMGATTEFMSKEAIAKKYGCVDHIMGGGWLHLKSGCVTDDTEMMMCVCRALMMDDGDKLHRGETFGKACRDEFVRWLSGGPADVGTQCRKAIAHMTQYGYPPIGVDVDALGNGGLMRALPCALMGSGYRHYNILQCTMTHNNFECAEAVSVYHNNIFDLVYGYGNRWMHAPQSLLDPTGHVYNTLNNALYWSSKSATFSEAIIGAVNDGGDADTIAALAGGLAGARFGYSAIPKEWCAALDSNIKGQLDEFIFFVESHIAKQNRIFGK